MRRDPRDLEEEREGGKLSGRAWGLVLGAWLAAFAFLAVVVLPLLFSLCGTA